MVEDIHALVLRIARSRFPEDQSAVEIHGMDMVEEALAGRPPTADKDPLEHGFGEALEMAVEIVQVISGTVKVVATVRQMAREGHSWSNATRVSQWSDRLEQAGLERREAEAIAEEFASDFSRVLEKVKPGI